MKGLPFVVALGLVAACATARAPTPAPAPAAAVEPATRGNLAADFDAGVDSILAPAGGTVGFAARDLGSGRSLGRNERQPFPMQSVFKLPIAIAVLHDVDAGKLDLDRVVSLGAEDARAGVAGAMAVPAQRTVGELLEAMIIRSDNTACDKLLALLGGPGVVDGRLRALGVDGITIRFSEKEMGAGLGDNSATPAAMVVLLEKIARQEVGLSPASARRLEDLLFRVGTGPGRLRGALPPGTPVAHKTGTSRTQDGTTDATNDVGLISLPNGHRVAIAVFVHASPADEATREQVIARIARAAYDALIAPAPPAHP
jgi:beta-lactamase class A